MDRAINRRIVVTKRGAPEVMQPVAEALPEPGPGEVRVEVAAAGVSGYDVMLRGRSFPGFPKTPYTPGEDLVGLVDAVGEGVTSLEVGQRVGAWTFGRAGCYAEFVCVPANEAVPVPKDVDAGEAVALIVNYLTAHVALHQTARTESGERLLVHGAAGGVGTALVQLGALSGLEIYGTASSYNHDLVAALGATPIDYRTEDFVRRIRELTGDGVDVVIDPIGGGRQLWRSYRALRKGGRLVMLGMAGTAKSGTKIIPPSLLTIGILKVLPDGRTVPMSPSMGDYPQEHNAWYQATLMEFFDLLAVGKMRPVIAARFPLLEAARAHEFIEQGGYTGKVVLVADE